MATSNAQSADVKTNTTKKPTKSQKSKRTSQQQAKMTKKRRSSRFSTFSVPSSTSSSMSWQSYLYFNKQNEEDGEEEEFEILDNLYDTDNESIEEEEPVYLQQPTLEETVDFFEEFGEVPDIEDISEDVAILKFPSKPHIKEDLSLDPHIDVGHFVNPLTGDNLSSSQSQLITELEVPARIHDIATSHDETNDISSKDESEMSDIYGDLDLTDETFEDDIALAKATDVDEAFETFLEMETKQHFVVEEEIDWETLAKQEEAKHIQQTTLAFVHDLIRKVVETAEYQSPNTILRVNLDKRKLMLELDKKCQDLEVEKIIQILLNQKIIDFYKRKKIFRPILPDTVKSVELEMGKCQYAIERLDRLLAKESNAIEETAKRKKDLQNELLETTDRAQKEVQQFEEMVKNNLSSDNRPKTNAVIDKLLLQMAQCRQEVTEVRFEYFIKQHDQAALMEKLNQMEDLGNGLTMKDFGTLQTETQALGKKIEERNVDLNKLHIRVRNDIHLISHYKEKQKMLRSAVVVQRMALEELHVESRIWREKINRLKIDRNRIRQQINELSFKGGLLDKPALMSDYDRTCEKVEERRDLVNYLKDIQQSLQEKLEDAMNQCSSSISQ